MVRVLSSAHLAMADRSNSDMSEKAPSVGPANRSRRVAAVALVVVVGVTTALYVKGGAEPAKSDVGPSAESPASTIERDLPSEDTPRAPAEPTPARTPDEALSTPKDSAHREVAPPPESSSEIAADELDERVLPRHYVSKLCKEVASLPDDTPHFTDLDGFLTVLRSRLESMPSYWNPRSRRSEPILKINRVKAYLMPRTAWWVPVGTTPRECKTFLILAALAIILFAFMVSSSSTSHVPRRYGPR